MEIQNSPNEFWIKWLEKYKSLRCLWDSGSEVYSNERLQCNAWEELINMAKTVKPDADLNYVKARVHNFFYIYRKDVKKIEAAKKTGDKYETSFCYDVLKDLYQRDKVKSVGETKVNNEIKKTQHKDNFKDVGKGRKMFSEKQFCIELCKKFASLPCLFNNAYKSEKMEYIQKKAWFKLLKFAKTMNPNIDLEAIKTRIRNLRCCYTRELRRINEAKRKGKPHTTKLYYFDALKPVYQHQYESSVTNIEYSDEPTDEEFLEEFKNEYKSLYNFSKKNNCLSESQSDRFVYAHPNATSELFHWQKVWLKVIRKYVSLKCLWDHENRDAYEDDERNEAWEKLLNIARTGDVKVNLLFLKKRISSMRQGVSRDLRIAKRAREKGKIFRSHLYYFEALSPLYQTNFPVAYNNSSSDEDMQIDEETLNPTFTTYFPEEEEDEKGDFNVMEEAESSLEIPNISPENPIELEFESIPKDTEIIALPLDTLNNGTSSSSSKNSEYEAFTLRLIQHLEQMDSEQFLLAEKLIWDVCILARMKKLTTESAITLSDNISS